MPLGELVDFDGNAKLTFESILADYPEMQYWPSYDQLCPGVLSHAAALQRMINFWGGW